MNTDRLVIRDLTKTFGTVTAVNQINMSIPQGKLYSFLGPSGCGKTTTLRMIAGLETPSSGQIIVDGRVLSDSKEVVLPEKRNMGMVFQSYAVWPHMSVWDNVAYGLKLKKMERSRIEKKVAEMLELVGLYHLRERLPTQLSGGQQQRVALARALANEPSILLLDEPLSNLDAKLRETMRFEIRSLQQRLGITAVYVTHSQDEALAVSDVIVIMRDGVILQAGSPEEVYSHPNSSFVAGFIGLANSFPARVVGAEGDAYVVELENGLQIRAAKHGKQWKTGEEVVLVIRPENISFDDWRNPGVVPNELKVKVERVSFTGSIVDYFLRIPRLSESLRCQTTPPTRFAEGQEATCYFAPEVCILTKE